MNRIILIGNGFDLAHNLKTSYPDFINFFWKKQIEEIKEYMHPNTIFPNDFLEIEMNNIVEFREVRYQQNNYDLFKEWIKDCQGYAFQKNNRNCIKVGYKNDFLKNVSEKASLQNWVDIEEEYYKQLKIIVNKPEKDEVDIEKLNKDFKAIKEILENYLTDENNKKIQKGDNLYNQIYSRFDVKNDFTNKGINEYVNELYGTYQQGLKDNENIMLEFEQSIDDIGFDVNNIEHVKDKIREEIIFQPKSEYFDLFPWKILFLSFNYTDTEQFYIKDKTSEVIHLHGKLKSKDNPIIFGYGDEQDELHKQIENLGGKYLDNVKTINYSKTDNYKKLLNFIENDIYQVFIMGHSCGMSDKTLLQTLFEHKNCISIKPFYFIKNEDNNYDDLIKNIYRVFTDKSLMRAKVVNEKYCEAYHKVN